MQPVQTKGKVDKEGGLVVVRYEGDITSASQDAVLGTYRQLSPDVTGIVLDFSKVPYLNSSGIALVIQLIMDANQTARKVSVFGLTPHFKKVFTLLGLTKHTTLHADEQEARAAVV
jgi:anti-anti-sigma factor